MSNNRTVPPKTRHSCLRSGCLCIKSDTFVQTQTLESKIDQQCSKSDTTTRNRTPDTSVQNRTLKCNVGHQCLKSEKKLTMYNIGYLCPKSDTTVQNRTPVSQISTSVQNRTFTPKFRHQFLKNGHKFPNLNTRVKNRKLVSNIEHFCPNSDKKV